VAGGKNATKRGGNRGQQERKEAGRLVKEDTPGPMGKGRALTAKKNFKQDAWMAGSVHDTKGGSGGEKRFKKRQKPTGTKKSVHMQITNDSVIQRGESLTRFRATLPLLSLSTRREGPGT